MPEPSIVLEHEVDQWAFFWARIFKGLRPPPGVDPGDWKYPLLQGILVLEIANSIGDKAIASDLRGCGQALIQASLRSTSSR